MIKIRKNIDMHISALTDKKIYYGNAPNNAKYPFIVYSFELFDLDESTQMINLEIDGYDNKSDTTDLEMMMKEVDLKDKIIFYENIGIKFERESRLSPLEENKNIKRRRYSYVGKLFEGGY